jgi:hypothetical protein
MILPICMLAKVESTADVLLQASERLDALGDVAHDARSISMIESPMAMFPTMKEIYTAATVLIGWIV